MSLTKTERTLLANQNRILALLDENNAKHYEYKTQIAERGYEGLYYVLLNSIEGGISKEICRETHDILTMYRAVNNFIAKLLPEQKEGLDLEKIEFEGFDGNNDSHYHFMMFIIEEGQLYAELKDAPMNSHSMATLGKYQRMLAVYNKEMDANSHNLNLDGLRAIIDAA